MAPDIGRAALIVGFMVALAQSLIPLAGAYKRDARMMMLGDKAAQAQAAFVDRKSTRLNSSHSQQSRMPSSA